MVASASTVLPFTSRLKRIVFSRCSILPRDLEGVKNPKVLRFFSTLTKSRRCVTLWFSFFSRLGSWCRTRFTVSEKLSSIVTHREQQQQACCSCSLRTCQSLSAVQEVEQNTEFKP